ncbi:hypothetical protein DXG03_003521 [Asterophora parasitica]|uniref:Uncharacterized protein n=1 Tax=Asterophora parasitica TaxID=117018 RepID=A0A9P7KG44_9AGAR|nr:hypothetical protein DXG03_003521 [Asterophora parasitica]
MFSQAVVRSLNDKNALLQKQLENVVREANGEISLLNNKTAELERDLELERRKTRELQDASRDREKEYQKLKVRQIRISSPTDLINYNDRQLAHDKFKRRALLAPHPAGAGHEGLSSFGHTNDDQQQQKQQRPLGMHMGNTTVNLGAVVGGMETNGASHDFLLGASSCLIYSSSLRSRERRSSTAP